MRSVFGKIIKTMQESFLICLICGIILIIINKFMGVDINFIYYLLLGTVCSLVLSLGLIFVNSKYIFSKPKKVRKKVKTSENKNIKNEPKTIKRKSNREIS